MLKDENVVKPPRKPTAHISLTGSGNVVCCHMAKAIKNPIRKLPATFTASVPKGNVLPHRAPIMVVARYLTTAPIPPPTKTNKIYDHLNTRLSRPSFIDIDYSCF